MTNLTKLSRPSSFLYAVLAISLLVIGGCWGSKYTLIPPEKAAVDRAYVGEWDLVNPQGEHSQMTVRNIDDHLYAIDLHDKDNSADLYVGFIATLNGSTFAHVRELAKDGSIQEGWYLMRVALADNNSAITIEQMDENFFKDKTINSPDQLKQVLTANLNNPAMYAKDQVIKGTRIAEKK